MRTNTMKTLSTLALAAWFTAAAACGQQVADPRAGPHAPNDQIDRRDQNQGRLRIDRNG